jgi:hypothetical protein
MGFVEELERFRDGEWVADADVDVFTDNLPDPSEYFSFEGGFDLWSYHEAVRSSSRDTFDAAVKSEVYGIMVNLIAELTPLQLNLLSGEEE